MLKRHTIQFVYAEGETIPHQPEGIADGMLGESAL